MSDYPEEVLRRDADLTTPLHLHFANTSTPNGVSLELVQILAPHCSLWEDGYLHTASCDLVGQPLWRVHTSLVLIVKG